MNKFHFIVFLTWQFGIFFAVQQIFSIFMKFQPKWKCVVPKNDDGNNSTLLYPAIFSKDCKIYRSCPKKHLEFEQVFYSTAMEFDWICSTEGEFFISAISWVQFVGVLLSTFIFSPLSDRYGRRVISIQVISAGIIILVLSALTSFNIYILLAYRFLLGVAIGGTIALITLVMELILPEQRVPLKAYVNWGMARILSTSLCYFLPNWRHASIASGLALIPLLLILIFVIPESPAWLYSKQKFEEMQISQTRISKISHGPIPEIHKDPTEKKTSYLDLWKDPKARVLVGIFCLMWFTASVTSYTNDLNSTEISGDFFMNQILFGVFIFASKIILGLTDKFYPQFNRRNLHQWNQLLVIIGFLGVAILFNFEYEEDSVFRWIQLAFNLIGTVCVEYTWDACYLCAIESVPSEVRTSALGTFSLMARIGSLLTPVMGLLSSLWPPAPYLIISGLGMLNLTMSCIYLPETKGKDLFHVKPKLHHFEEDEQNGYDMKILNSKS